MSAMHHTTQAFKTALLLSPNILNCPRSLVNLGSSPPEPAKFP